MNLDLTSRECKGHPRTITTTIKPLPCLLGVPLLILPGPHPLLGHILLNTKLHKLLIRFTLMLSHSLSGIHLIRGGGPSITLLLLFCLHHLLNHNHYLLLHQENPKYLLNQTRTRTLTTDRPSKYIVEKYHARPMLWRFRRLTYDLGRFSQIANLLLRRMRKKNRKVNKKSFHPFLRD